MKIFRLNERQIDSFAKNVFEWEETNGAFSQTQNFESRNVEYDNVSAQRENNPVDPGLINIAIEMLRRTCKYVGIKGIKVRG